MAEPGGNLLIRTLVAALVASALGAGCGSPYPSCPGGRYVYDPETGALVSGPPPVEDDVDPPWVMPKSLPPEGKRSVVPDGFPRPGEDSVTDKGPADGATPVRVLVGLKLRNSDRLDDWLEGVYDPRSSAYLEVLSPSCFRQDHAPTRSQVGRVKAFLESHGMTVSRLATNRLLLWARGTVAQANEAFGFEALDILRSGKRDYGTAADLTIPEWLAADVDQVLGLQDLPDDDDDPPVDSAKRIHEAQPSGYTPAQVGAVYGLKTLHDAGHDGRGQAIGVIGGFAARWNDCESYWEGLGLQRTGKFETRYLDAMPGFSPESTLDVQVAGAAAPGADVIMYAGADNSELSLAWSLNEAVALGEASTLTISYAHNESTIPWEIQRRHHISARIAAAEGIMFASASGDWRRVDTPGNSPWVTSVGATALKLAPDGTRESEVDAFFGGRGRSGFFRKPAWQAGIDTQSDRRVTVDLALHCYPSDTERALWMVYKGEWQYTGGTSAAAPFLAGMVTCVNQARGAKGRLGFVNRVLYESEALQKSFFDVTEDMVEMMREATEGWDFGTGWGAPRVDRWVDLIP